MTFTERKPIETANKPEGRLSLEDQRILAAQLRKEVDTFVDTALGVSAEAKDKSGEVRVLVKDGYYQIARDHDRKTDTSEIRFVSAVNPDADVSLVMSKSSWEPEAGFTITDPRMEGREHTLGDKEGILAFNPNQTPHPIPGRDDEAFRALTDFLTTAQAETQVPVGELIQ